MNKWIRQMVLPCILLLCLTTTAVAAEFSDVSTSDWFSSEIELLVDKGVIAGYTDGSFKPYNSVTVGEFAKMLCTLWGYTPEDQPDSHWAKEYVDLAYQYRWIDTYPTDLDAAINRLDVSDAVLASLGIIAYDSDSNPFYDTNSAVAETMYEMGILNGSTTQMDGATVTMFYPDATITRAELCAILNRSYNYLEEVYAVTDFRYRLPQVATPGSTPEITEEYLYNLCLYMMVTDTTSYQLNFQGLTYDQMKVQGFETILNSVYSQVRNEYHEIGAFYDTWGANFSTRTERGQTVTTCTVNISSASYDNPTLIGYKNAFLAALPQCITPIYEEGYMRADMTDYEKAQYLFWWCAYNFKYDTYFSSISYNGYGILANNTGVCQAYVSIYNAMCKMAGIEIVGVSGTVDGGNHIWSYADLDGTWYYIDPTFGDPTPDRANYCDYSYFAMTLEEIQKTHVFD